MFDIYVSWGGFPSVPSNHISLEHVQNQMGFGDYCSSLIIVIICHLSHENKPVPQSRLFTLMVTFNQYI